MDKTYQLNNYTVKVSFHPRLLRFYSNNQLWGFINKGNHIAFSFLMEQIKTDYLLEFNKPLQITNDSLEVEIIGHIFFHNLGLEFTSFINIPWINKVVKKLIKRAEVIDCGESKIDGNRWLWDFLAKHKSLVSKFLTKKKIS